MIQLKKSIKLVMFNKYVFHPFFYFLDGFLNNFEPFFSFSVEDLPSPKTLFLQILFIFLIEDLLFHLGHRLMHQKPFY